MDERVFRYSAVDPAGRTIKGEIVALDAQEATRRLQADKLTPFDVRPAPAVRASGRRRAAKLADRLMTARQLSIMLEAGVPLLSALDNVARAFPNAELSFQLKDVMQALRRGERLGAAFAACVPGFPTYVYALLTVGEQTGRLPEVLRQAADQMAFEDRLGRDVQNALTYPAFLLAAGGMAVAFLFYEVVPRFSAMIGEDRAGLPAVSRLVLDVGEAVRTNGLAIALAVAAGVVGLRALAGTESGRRTAAQALRVLPVMGAVLRARDLASWSRLVGFGLTNGLALLPAMKLARSGVTNPAMAQGLQEAERALRGGEDVDVALAGNAPLSAMDLAVVRTGQRSGALGSMFLLLADTHEQDVRDTIKRATSLIEPAALAVIAVIVGTIAVSLALALSSVYDRVG